MSTVNRTLTCQGLVHRETGLWFLGFDSDGQSLWGSGYHWRVWRDEPLFAECQALLLDKAMREKEKEDGTIDEVSDGPRRA